MKTTLTINFILAISLISCSDRPSKSIHNKAQAGNVQYTIPLNDFKNDSSYVFTGFYFLSDDGYGIKMRKDHSDEQYTISQAPFVSVNSILRANVQKNVFDGQDIYGVSIVLDNAGTKDLEKGTGNAEHPYIAVVIANRLLYVVENKLQIHTGILQLHLNGYTEKEIKNMIDAINHKR